MKLIGALFWAFLCFCFAIYIAGLTNTGAYFIIYFFGLLAISAGGVFFLMARAERLRVENAQANFGEYAPQVIARKVAIGMTPDMVVAAWGSPSETHNEVSATKKTVIWQWCEYRRRRKYVRQTVSFVNDKVTNIKS